MSEMIDIEAIYRQERQRWLHEEAPRRSLRDVIAGSVPYWIILVALVSICAGRMLRILFEVPDSRGFAELNLAARRCSSQYWTTIR